MRSLSRLFSDWSPTAAISRRRQQWKNAAELRNCGEEAIEEMAHDIGLAAAELRQLSRKGAHAADLLPRRMAALDLDPKEVGHLEPLVLRDMARVCSMCESHGRCLRDLTRDSSNPIWKQYCPNVGTLAALDAQPWATRRES